MKTLLIAIILVNFSIAESISKPVRFHLPKDVGSGNPYFKSLENDFKKHGVKVVKKKDGFPVRAGKKSLRFEVRFGDCGFDLVWNDCKKDRQRHELSTEIFNGKKWTAFSIYLPKNFKSVYPVKLAMGQFKQIGGSPNLMFQFTDTGFWADRQLSYWTQEMKKLLDIQDMIGKWNDILIYGNFTKNEDGFFKIWVNNKLKYEYYGKTTSGKPNVFKFGIYQTHINRYSSKPYPTQIVFYDEIRHGKSKKGVVKNLY